MASVPGHAEWLSAEEKQRAERYRQPAGGSRYRATRVLVRGVLAGLLGRLPSELTFTENAHGRPGLASGTLALDFNVSRCPSWLALVVTSGAACGVDVEDTSRKADILGIARAFAAEERAALVSATAEERRRLFFLFWTLKEATLKALGTGLTLSLGACAFELQAGKPPAVRYSGAISEDARAWCFAQLAPDAGHALAVAVRTPPPLELLVHTSEETCAALASL